MTDRDPTGRHAIPFRAELEARFNAPIVTFDDRGGERPGGMCRCCGAGPNPEPDYQAEPFYIYQAGLCDVDGEFYAMLCEGCLEEVRFENEKRIRRGVLAERDEAARQIMDLMDGDLDGAQTFMDDFE